MLYIISSNEKNITNQLSTSGATLSETGSIQEDKLDDLIKMIDEDIEEKEISGEVELGKNKKSTKSFFSFLPWIGGKKENISENDLKAEEKLLKQEEVSEVLVSYEKAEDSKEISGEAEIVDTETKTGFLAKIFGGNDDRTQEISGEAKISDSSTEENTAEENTVENISKDITPVSGRDSFIGVADNNSTLAGLHIVKNTNKKHKVATTYASYNGVQNATKIGDVFSVGVYSLKLNNKYFNETLAYLVKGDVVEQVSEENIYGCFEVLVSSSKNTNNIGKEGYVCKKYLKQQDNTSQNSDADQVMEGTLKDTAQAESLVYTSVGSYYKTELDELCFDDETIEGEEAKFVLPKGDILKQVSDFNTLNGCAEMKVVGSAVEENHGKIVSICSLDMVSPIK